MKLINPFKKKEPSQEQLLKEQQKLNIESETFSHALHPQDVDSELLLQRESQMAELTKWQQNLEPMHKELFLNLAGLDETDDKLVSSKIRKSWCSVSTAARWVDFIKPIANQNTMNGAWSIKEINDTIIAVDQTIRQDIKEHWKEFEVEYSIATMNLICEAIINPVYSTLKRGLDNGERKYHGQIQKIIETKNIAPEKKKAGIFGKE